MTDIALRLTQISEATWIRGHDLASLSMRKLFEKAGEAYYEWNSSLPGFVPPHAEVGQPFESERALRAGLDRIVRYREKLRHEMIARQEEMDWLVYQAYGLIEDAGPSLPESDLSLAREERPFCLWATAGGDFSKAVELIPAHWSPQRKQLWRQRLQLIRDSEHVRRIEQPVYKRRWDEQWKVGNRWQCGPPAYDAEFMDAFDWWLSEKAEWWLEKNGKAVGLVDWTTALWKDTRIHNAWAVAADAACRLEAWSLQSKEATTAPPPPDGDLLCLRAPLRRFGQGTDRARRHPVRRAVGPARNEDNRYCFSPSHPRQAQCSP
jgi:hypothetical protein